MISVVPGILKINYVNICAFLNLLDKTRQILLFLSPENHCMQGIVQSLTLEL